MRTRKLHISEFQGASGSHDIDGVEVRFPESAITCFAQVEHISRSVSESLHHKRVHGYWIL